MNIYIYIYIYIYIHTYVWAARDDLGPCHWTGIIRIWSGLGIYPGTRFAKHFGGAPETLGKFS